MKTKFALFFGIMLGFYLMPLQLIAQTKYDVGKNVELKLTGTSSLHDWEMVSKEAIGEGILILQNGNLEKVESLSVQMPAESIKSGKGAMDRNAYSAIDTKKHKQVQFVLRSFTKSGTNTWKANGDFTIAGVRKSAAFDVKSSQAGSNFKFEGKHAFNLTDYSIDPPTALLGTVKTGDEVTIHFNITLQPAQ